MTTSTTLPADYRRALEHLASAGRDCRALADLLDHFASDLRGSWVRPGETPAVGRATVALACRRMAGSGLPPREDDDVSGLAY
jgi:hypothetical protein